MALETSGFQVPASIRAPEIPSNIGKVDVKGIYDSVTNALRSYEAIRTAPAMQNAVDAELALKTTRDTIEKGLVAPEAAARAANANLLKSKSEAGMGLVAPQTEAERQKALLTTAEAGVGLGTVAQRAESDRLKRKAEDVANTLRSDPVLAKRMLENKSLTSTVRTINELQSMLADPTRTEDEKAAIRIQLKLQQNADQKAADDLAKSGVGLMQLNDGRVVRFAKTGTGAEILGAPETRIGSFSPLATPAPTGTAMPPAESLRFGDAPIPAPVQGMTAPAAPAAAAPTAVAPTAAAAGPAVNPFTGVTPEEKKAIDIEVARKGGLQKTFPFDLAAIEASKNAMNLVETQILRTLNLIEDSTTGMDGLIYSYMPETNSYTLKENLKTLKANLGFERLQEMRSLSKTGGALGNVALQELEALQNSIAPLSQGLDANTLKQSLEAVRTAKKTYQNTYEDRFNRLYAEILSNNSEQVAPNTLPSGGLISPINQAHINKYAPKF